MKKKILLFILSTLLSHAWVYAQEIYEQWIYKYTSIYVETGFNTLSKINYTNSNHIDYESEINLLPQKSNKVGLRHQISKKSFISMSLSNNTYSYTNNLYIPINSTTKDHIHIKSIFKLDYLGVNLGLDFAVIQKGKWSIFTCGKFSRNILEWGVRKDEVINADPSILPNPNSDLMLDENFKKQWLNIHFGLALSHKVSPKLSLYTEYNFNQSLTSIKKNQESYDFNSHTFSIGLTCSIYKRWEK